MNSDNEVKPFLRWAGSKRKVVNKLRSYFPESVRRYIEPFAGSACVFFDLNPNEAVLSDLNAELIETYLTVRSRPIKVGEALAKMPVSRDDYYFFRSVNISALSKVERAARFIYLNRFCFNGLFRTNMAGQFNVPYGAPKNNRVPSVSDLQACAARLRLAKIECGDFERVIRENAKQGDLVYLDPPFFQKKRRVFREYNAKPFEESDLARLVTLLKDLDARGTNFLVSYAMCPEAKTAFKDWNRRRINTYRNISGFGQHRGLAQEIVVMNYGD